MPKQQNITLSLDAARALSRAVLKENGYSPSQADAIAENVVTVQADGCDSHGLYRLLDCVSVVRRGGVNPTAVPEIVDRAPGIVRVDANGGSSLLAFAMGRDPLIAKARQQGVAALVINNAFHFSALWPDVESIANKGLAALAMNPSLPYVAPAGGKAPLMGTNPFAFSWPRSNDEPFTFDFATSVVARGEIELYRRAGKEIPEGWAIDDDGRATTDPTAAMAGALLPFGGYKGSALSLMIELLAGPLIGDALSFELRPAGIFADASPRHGELVLAFAPEKFSCTDLASRSDRAERLFASVVEQGARLPSMRRHYARRRSQLDGVVIPAKLHTELLELKNKGIMSSN